MEQMKRTQTRKPKKKNDVNMLTKAMVIAVCLYMFTRILLTHMLGDLGNGYYSLVATYVTFLVILVNAGIPHVLSKLLLGRFSKNLWKNANRMFLVATLISVCLSGIFLIGTIIFARQLAIILFEQSMVRLVLQCMIPGFFILTLIQLLRGYFQGFGTRVPTAVSFVIEQVVLSISSLICMYLFYQKGVKVGALLHDPNYGPAFGAAGAALGTLIGGIVTLLFLSMIYIPQCKNMKKLIQRDTTIRVESFVVTLKIWLRSAFPVFLALVLIYGCKLFDVIVFSNAMSDRGTSHKTVLLWGIYQGKYQILLLLPGVIAVIGFVRAYLATQNKYHKEELPYVREQIAYRMRMAVLPGVLFPAFYIGFAKTIVHFVFSGERVGAIQMLQSGGITILFWTISAIALGCLYGTDQKKMMIRNLGIYAISHMVFTYIFVVIAEFDVIGALYAEVISSCVLCIINVWTLQKVLHYRQEYISTFLKPCLSGVIVTIVLTLIQLLFGNMFPLLVLVIGIIVAIAGFFISLSVLKALREKDYVFGPSGVKLIQIAKTCRLLP